MAKEAVEKYLKDLGEIYRTGGGVEEESYYDALASLLNEVGRKLKPKVRCVSQLKNTGGGEPDFGFFTANQFQRSKDAKPIPGQLPERGVVECKPWNDDSFAQTKSAQISKYWKRYGVVLVSNFHDFVLVGRNEEGKAVRLESYRMASSENEFRAMLAHPRKTAQEQGERLQEFLRRAMLHAAPLTEPEDLAWFLASYAREARERLEEKAELPALEGLKKALEEALGMKFEGGKGEHFFEATLVQTLFYGVFSSWVLWSRDHWGKPEAKFDWHKTAWTLHVPMIASLFDQIAMPNRLKPLGIAEVLDWAGMVLNRVDRNSFFSKFEEEHAVQYFYEPFLKAYDPQLRKQLGVWFTPPEIVKYQVERVDRVLREELDIADGLADEKVIVLDPCCGTGAYLVESLRRIYKTLEDKGGGALTAQKLKQAAKERVFGFEILPAPFVVSHLQIGLMLRKAGAPLNAEGSERAAVYLTNALTGWEPLEDPKSLLPFPELLEEREAASKVKQDAPILVIIGNPPYNAFAGTSPEEEGGLVDCYKEGLTKAVKDGGWGIKKFNLDELYVRFFRIAERRIAKNGKGIVSYISNFSYLYRDSFVVMRQHFLEEFDRLWIDCMNGDSRETGKLTPEGKPDPSVFSTEQHPVGIKLGTAISVMVRKKDREHEPTVCFQHYWGETKRKDLLDSLNLKNFEKRYKKAQPNKSNKYSFRPSKVSDHYLEWPLLNSLAEISPITGYKENRGFVLIDDSRNILSNRMEKYFSSECSWEELCSANHGLTRNAARFDARTARKKVTGAEKYDPERLKRYLLRPFEVRWCYYSPVRPLWNEPRPALFKHNFDGNAFLVSRSAGTASPEGTPFYWTTCMGDFDFMRGHSYHSPILISEEIEAKEADLAADKMFGVQEAEVVTKANLSDISRAYLKELGISNPDKDLESAGLIWMHSLAIGYSPAYLAENADGIREGWPRIALPRDKKTLLKSAKLGRRVASLLDTEKAVTGVTSGKIDARLKGLGVVTRVEGGGIRPDKGELDITAGWGHAGKGGICMPGQGKYVLRAQLDEELRKAFGAETLDIYLNDAAYWANVPKCVWEYYIGGYQVIKKWLSYREKSMLGRGLKLDEAEYVTEMVRRLAALVLLREELDSNYEAVKVDTWLWPKDD